MVCPCPKMKNCSRILKIGHFGHAICPKIFFKILRKFAKSDIKIANVRVCPFS